MLLHGLFSSCREWAPQCGGFSLRSTGIGHAGSSSCSPQALKHRLRCPEACGIIPDQGPNLCRLLWRAESLPLSHQGSSGRKHFVNQQTTTTRSCKTELKGSAWRERHFSLTTEILSYSYVCCPIN